MYSFDVSVIVPVYNPPLEALRKFLNSLVGQSLERIEIILVDDASSGEAPKVLDELALIDHRVKVIHRTINGRAGIARSNGLEIASGEYVLFADADDILEEDMCQNLYELGRHHGVDIVASSWYIEDSSGRICGRGCLPNKSYDLTSRSDQIKGVRYLHHALWNKIFRRSMIGDIRFNEYQVNIGEDRLFNIECFCRSRKMVTTTYFGYHYVLHPMSATGRTTKGVSYLDVLVSSEEDVVQRLSRAGAEGVLQAYSDIWALRTFAVGCSWIAEKPGSSERDFMWSYWYSHFHHKVIPNITTAKFLASWYRLLVATGNPRLVWDGVWRVTKIASYLYELLALIRLRRSGSNNLI